MDNANMINKEDCNIVNSAFHLFEAGDMLLREFERRLNNKKMGMRHETKKRVTDMLNYIHKCEFCAEALLKDYNDAFLEKISNRYEEIRRIASYYARLSILIGDRCNNSNSWQKESLIMDFIKTMPDNGNIDEETLNNLIIK